MGAQVSWLVAEPILNYEMSGYLTLPELMNCVAAEKTLLAERPQQDLYVLADISFLRTIPRNYASFISQTVIVTPVVKAFVVVGATPFYKTLIGMLSRAIWNRESTIVHVKTRAEGLAYLRQAMRETRNVQQWPSARQSLPGY